MIGQWACGFRWHPVLEVDEENWYLAVAQAGSSVIVAGGQPGNTPTAAGRGVLRMLPASAESADEGQLLKSTQPGMFWWVHAADAQTAWLCGESGSVVRLDVPSQTQQVIPTNTRATLYGIWAFSDDDVWAVGAVPFGAGVILHGGRGGLAPDPTAPVVGALYKLFSPAPQVLFAVGQDGTLLRRIEGTWRQDQAPTRDRMLTVYGTGQEIYAVGGLGMASLFQFHADRAEWTADRAVASFSALAGLAVSDQHILIAGERGLLAVRDRSAAPDSSFSVAEPLTNLDLHGVLLTPQRAWAVGGNLSQVYLRPPRGVILAATP